jgi:hypothetical protein
MYKQNLKSLLLLFFVPKKSNLREKKKKKVESCLQRHKNDKLSPGEGRGWLGPR